MPGSAIVLEAAVPYIIAGIALFLIGVGIGLEIGRNRNK